MINGPPTAKVAPRRVKYRVRHFGGVFVFGLFFEYSKNLNIHPGGSAENPGGTAKVIDFE